MSARNLGIFTKMLVFVFIVSTLLPSLMCKEHAPSGVSEDEKEILYKIIKRLEMGELRNSESTTTVRPSSSPSSETESTGVGLNTCVSQLNAKTTQQSIIRTQESISNGAVFLRELSVVDSKEICADECCRNSSCDTAVFENKPSKGKHNCYLFQCQGKCTFDHHQSYITTEIVRPATPLPSSDSIEANEEEEEEEEEEDNLDPLNSNTDGDDQDADIVSESESRPSTQKAEEETTTPTTAPSTSTSTTSVASSSKFLRPHSVKLGGECHRDLHCKDPAAECNYRHCVCRMGYQLTDGACVSKQGDMNGHGDDDETGGDEDSKIEEHAEDKSDKEDQDEEDSHEEKPASSEEEKQEEGNQSSSEEDGKDKEDEGEPDSAEEVEEDHAEEESSHPSAPKATTSSSTGAPSSTTEGGFMSRMEKAVEVGDLQLPIIALSLGLSFTFILLVFVTCRLRRVRKQLRKGRPLHGNEADYLINGMYL